MANTPNMGLPIDVVSQTPGPDWATDIEATKLLIDAHTHTSGAGVQVPTAGLNINAAVPFGGYGTTNMGTLGLVTQGTTNSGTANLFYNNAGNVYWNNASGVPIQITTATGLNMSSVGGISGLGGTTANWTYSTALTTFIGTADTNKSAAVDAGAFTVRETNVANAKGVTLKTVTSMAADYNMTLPAGAPSVSGVMLMDTSGNIAVSRVMYPAGHQVGFGQTVKTAEQATTATIPQDDTVPQIGEGDQVSTLAYTPTKIGNLLLVEVVIQATATAGTDTSLVASIYKDADANALATGDRGLPGATTSDDCGILIVRHTHTVVSLAAATWQYRIGTRAGSSVTINRGSANDYGGNMNSQITIREIAQ